MTVDGAPPETEVPAESVPDSKTGAAGPSENVDRIRDILFGSQMREYAQRFRQLEERIVRETGELKAEVRRHLDFLEAHTRQETEVLADRLNTERSERAESAERISKELSEAVKSLDKRIRQSDEQMSKELREFRQSELDRHRSLADELMQSIASAGLIQGRRLEELRASAVDRLALADFLTELALRIRGEFAVSRAELQPSPAARE